MAEINEKNRNVDLLTKATNREAKKHAEKIWFVARSALKNHRNHVIVLRTMRVPTIVPNESAKEGRELVITTPELVKLTVQQEINCFLPVRFCGKLFLFHFSLPRIEDSENVVDVS